MGLHEGIWFEGVQEGVKNTRKCITMVEYIVEDRQGRRHATLAPAPLRAQWLEARSNRFYPASVVG